MKFYGLDQVENSVFHNLTLDHNTTFPDNPSLGELFFKTTAPAGLYCYDGNAWVLQGSPGGTGTIASQNADNVSITGGSITATAINNSTIGATLPAAGRFTTIKLNGTTYNPFVLAFGPGSNVGWTNSTDTGVGPFLTSDGNHLRFLNSSAECMRLTSDKNLLINTTTDDLTNRLQVVGNAKISGRLTVTTPSGSTAHPLFVSAQSSTGPGNLAVSSGGDVSLTGGIASSGVSSPVLLTTMATTGSSSSANIALGTGNTSGDTSSVASGSITIATGSDSAFGNSGNITIQTGSVTSGTAGSIAISAGGLSTINVTPSGITIQGTFTLAANPTSNLHAATKQYVDNLLSNLTIDGGTY